MSQQLRRYTKYILLVEDELETRLMIQLMLHLCKCRVDFAEDGLTAVKLACTYQYDCILMDVGLPKLNGIDATIAIKQYQAQKNSLKATPIIAITENAQSNEIEKCIEVGMNTILIKPIKSQYLDRLIASF